MHKNKTLKISQGLYTGLMPTPCMLVSMASKKAFITKAL